MIVQILGNIKYPITLDPTVWIFDDRKVLFEKAFGESQDQFEDERDELKEAADRFARETFIKPPVNKSISRFERDKILINTYVMPIKDFLKTAEINQDANQVKLVTGNTEQVISISQLEDCLLLFAKDGKPIREDGPIHLFFGDGSNKENPIKGVKKIIVE